MPETPSPSYRSVPGPVDRESFFAQQRRYRRRTWQLSALCALAVLLMGIPLSVVVSPLVWAVAVVGADVASLATPTPDIAATMFQMIDGVLGTSGAVPASAVVALAVALIVPGVVVMGVVSLGLRALVRRSGTDGVLQALGARPLREDDFEEHQLANVVEEMAIAAGIPAPRVMLLDGPAINAGAIGPGHDAAVVLVSRGLLDRLHRDEIQAVIGHVIASVGNGDLRASLAMIGVAQTLGSMATLLGAPFSPRARTALGHVARATLRRGRGEDERVARARALLETATTADDPDDLESAEDGTRWRDVLTLPFRMAQAAFWMNRKIFVSLLVGPALASMWWARRFLADATAVQLTRDPDALARGLARLAAQDDVIPGAAWSAHLFIVGRNAAKAGRAAGSAPAGVGDGAPAEPFDSIVPFDPPLSRRIDRLRAAGATFDLPNRRPPRSPAATVALAIFAAAFVVPIAAILGGAALALVYLALAIDMLFLLPVVGGLHLLLRR